MSTLYAELYNVEEESLWFENPGGISGNVLSRLPCYLRIEANVLAEEMNASKSGTLFKLLSYMFEDVRNKSENYKKTVEALFELSKEMNPDDEEGAFS